MNEEILSFVWRFGYYESVNLRTDEGSHLSVLRTGFKNRNAGPDFSDARVRIDGVDWVGCVEIHVKSSDWFLHTHETDPAYESVVLHVVWENDKPVYRQDSSLVPTLSLKGLVRLSVIERYNQLVQEDEEIPCSKSFEKVSELQKFSMLDRVLLERLDKKGEQVLNLLNANQQDWEETAYQWLTQHFGFKLNDPAFLRLSQAVPLKIILKHRNSLLQIEAILFGTAGLIPGNPEVDQSDITSLETSYIIALNREYKFLSAKYRLQNTQMKPHEWKFLRLRPAGFPTIRLAQLAVLLSKSNGLFSSLTSPKTVRPMHELLNLEQSEYWQKHFQFGKISKSKVPAMGKDAINLLIINAVVPLMVAYSKNRQQPEILERAISWLSEIPTENNRITREWEKLGMKVKTAGDSQALIEWFNNYCSKRKCLDCIVGSGLVRS
ncbi:DUF2851 family protein [Dyadobacter psychrotolerans]|uniref:DUF2851 family protein n=1 Tax=Dyadobacter psychrotolerans TaxID=2541721 RepID=A0A4R5E0T6_9BACT|nr:DUF2851 family protein [Dyadobacter psychrotolerans]TDE18191.1 DUF2851 family protein [Dyadobacter psychrotolerans]